MPRSETVTFALVWLACMVLLALTLLASQFSLGPWKPFANLGIATAKAALIMWFFMHLREASGLVRLFAFGALFWLGVLFWLGLNDWLTRPPW